MTWLIGLIVLGISEGGTPKSTPHASQVCVGVGAGREGAHELTFILNAYLIRKRNLTNNPAIA